VAIPWAVALGYLRLMTNARVLPRPLTMAVALGHLRLWIKQPSVLILQPGPRHLGILTGFCEAGTLSGPLLTDAHIAALAIENQAIVHSNDSDFSRFAGLRWINPLAGPRRERSSLPPCRSSVAKASAKPSALPTSSPAWRAPCAIWCGAAPGTWRR
jgi:toxin-antitoxin system PIN domain toxin